MGTRVQTTPQWSTALRLRPALLSPLAALRSDRVQRIISPSGRPSGCVRTDMRDLKPLTDGSVSIAELSSSSISMFTFCRDGRSRRGSLGGERQWQ